VKLVSCLLPRYNSEFTTLSWIEIYTMSGKKVPLWILDLQSDICKKFHMPVQKIQLIFGLADYQRT